MDGIQLESDYAPAFNAWKAGPSPATNSALLTAVKPIIDTTLRQYSGGNPSPSLKSRAKILALNSFKTYDPTKGRLRTHLYSHMQGLQRINAQEQNIISVPERVALDYNHVQEASNALRDRLGRDPSNAEISNHTGLSAKRLAYIRQSNLPVSESTPRVIKPIRPSACRAATTGGPGRISSITTSGRPIRSLWTTCSVATGCRSCRSTRSRPNWASRRAP